MQALLIQRFYTATRTNLVHGFTWCDAALDARRRGQPKQTVKAMRWIAYGKLDILD